MKRFLDRNLPPGYSRTAELWAVAIGFVWAGLSAGFRFGIAYSRHRQSLYVRRGIDLFLDPGRVMPDFVAVLGDALEAPLLYAALAFVCASAVHYAQFYSGGKSIYTMRRLPRRAELARRTFLLPALWALGFLALAGAALLLFYAVYMTRTPAVCLTPGQWQKLWEVLL